MIQVSEYVPIHTSLYNGQSLSGNGTKNLRVVDASVFPHIPGTFVKQRGVFSPVM